MLKAWQQNGRDKNKIDFDQQVAEKCTLGMKMDQIRTNITDIVFVFIFVFEYGLGYG